MTDDDARALVRMLWNLWGEERIAEQMGADILDRFRWVLEPSPDVDGWDAAREAIVATLRRYDLADEPTHDDLRRLMSAAWRQYTREAES